jgi:uncharacterized protein
MDLLTEKRLVEYRLQYRGDSMGVTDDLAVWQKRLETRLATLPASRDGSHDIGHCRRVWRHAQSISAGMQQRADQLVLLAAAYLHDIVSPPKNSPLRAQASQHAAKAARCILSEMAFPADRLDKVVHAIKAHSHSAHIEPETPEARILQDADRLEALGAIGIARLFYEAGRMRSKLFHDADPAARSRTLDEMQYALDHYYKKSQHLLGTMQTEPGRAMARKRSAFAALFVEALIAEAIPEAKNE